MALVGSHWFPYHRPHGEAQLRLLCLPCAGGAASSFRPWVPQLPVRFELLSVQYPGRETRFSHPAAGSLEELVEGVAAALEELPPRPLIILGHSFGALVGFELCRRLERAGRPPLHFIPAGAAAPHLPRHVLEESVDDPTLVRYLESLDGLPRHVLEHPELLQLVLPVVRADFRAYNRYRFQPGPPLKTPVSAFGGQEDPLGIRSRLEAWSQLAERCTIRVFPGHHSFVHAHRQEVIAELSRMFPG